MKRLALAGVRAKAGGGRARLRSRRRPASVRVPPTSARDRRLRQLARPGQGLPKAGVHAVRMAPVLAGKLRAALPGPAAAGDLATADGQAIAPRGRCRADGARAWRWKDRIDRRFLQQVNAQHAVPAPAAAPAFAPAQAFNPVADVSAAHPGDSR